MAEIKHINELSRFSFTRCIIVQELATKSSQDVKA